VLYIIYIYTDIAQTLSSLNGLQAHSYFCSWAKQRLSFVFSTHIPGMHVITCNNIYIYIYMYVFALSLSTYICMCIYYKNTSSTFAVPFVQCVLAVCYVYDVLATQCVSFPGLAPEAPPGGQLSQIWEGPIFPSINTFRKLYHQCFSSYALGHTSHKVCLPVRLPLVVTMCSYSCLVGQTQKLSLKPKGQC
jgi:hypothetical protein